MMRYFLFFCTLLMLLFIPQRAFADIRLAVLDFQGVGVSNVLLQQLADEARTGVVQVSSGQKFNGEKLIIMTRENMMQILKDQGLSAADCTGACEVEIAKNIGADYVLSGNLNKIDTLYALVIKLHSTSDSNLLSSESFKTESKKDLILQTSNVSSKVFQVGLKFSPSHNVSSGSGFSNRGGFSHSNNGFGSGVQGNLKQKLKEKKCREFAQTEAKRQRAKRIETEMTRLKREATKAWNAMQEDFSTCLELDLEDRGPCQDALDAWYVSASTLNVTLESGSEQVDTDCGVKEEVFETISRTVEVAELEEAKQMREKLKRKSTGDGSVSAQKLEEEIGVQSSSQPGTLTVKIKGDATRVGISGCARSRKSISGNQVTFSNVPLGKCTLKFEPSGLIATVRGGKKTVTCTISGNKAICWEDSEQIAQKRTKTPQTASASDPLHITIFVASRKSAKITCKDGQIKTINGKADFIFRKKSKCLVDIAGAKGFAKINKSGAIRCTTSNDRVTCK